MKIKVLERDPNAYTCAYPENQRVVEQQINVGDAATVRFYTDREPCTVIAVDDKAKTVTVQHDCWVRTDGGGMSDCQEYEYSQNPNGIVETFCLTRTFTVGKHKINALTDNGRIKDYGCRLYVGHRERYHDFGF